MSYFYTAYGLVFQSNIELPELLSAQNHIPDVTIQRVQKLSSPLPSGTATFMWESSANQFVQRIPDVANFLVRGGKEIEVEFTAACDDKDVRIYILGSVMAALLQQRGFLTLHASAIWTELGAVLFIGRSGAGKSTLLNALRKRGYRMMCDDVTAVQLNDKGFPEALSAYPRTRLWKDSTAKLAIETAGVERVSSDLEKYSVPVEGMFVGCVPIHRIFLLTDHNQATIQVEPLNARMSFSWLQKYTYRKRFVRGNALMRFQFETVSAISEQIKVMQITRPSHLFLLDELVEKVVASFAA